MTNIQAVRGMNDILPEEIPYWQLLEAACRDIAARYGYHEIRFPIVEQTDLFDRTIGHTSDIIEKEMYTFEDRSGVSLSLRPEGTAGCVRAGIENGLLYNQIQRLWYIGPMFRHERPQKGRTRQFFQFGIEAFGIEGPHVDAEQILLTANLLQTLGIEKNVKLQINSLGSSEARKNYRKILVDYFTQFQSQLDEDSQRRLHANPMRILDSKNPDMQKINADAPKITEYLDENSKQHFAVLCELLDKAGLQYQINPSIVRGLDYYQKTVYEWVTDELGAQGTICAGGRYDTLVEQLGGKPTHAVGFALGLERTVLLLQKQKPLTQPADIYMVLVGEREMARGLIYAEKLRKQFPLLKIETNLNGGNFKSQFKKADKSGARLALILAESEIELGQITVKNLREEKPQLSLSWDELLNFLTRSINERLFVR